MGIFEWLSDPNNSDAIKAGCALIGVPGSIWGGYLLFKKLRGIGLDDRVNTVNEKADRLLLENQRLRLQMHQDRKLIEKILLKLEPGDVTPDLIQNIEEVAKVGAGTSRRDERRVESLAEQLREQIPARASVPLSPPQPSDTYDPLLELARLIGRTDPFAPGHFEQ
jgi:hypothetical protein